MPEIYFKRSSLANKQRTVYFRKRTTLQTLQIRITMKRNILLLIILTVISLEASGQKYTIYVDDFNSEIKIPNRAINLIRLAFIDGIRNTNRINVVDAVSAGSDLSLSPLEDARRFRAEYLLKGNLIQREATDDGSSHRRYHSRENSYKEKFTLRLDLIRTSDGVTISTRNYEETGSASGKDATQYSALENSLINVPYEMGLFCRKSLQSIRFNTESGIYQKRQGKNHLYQPGI